MIILHQVREERKVYIDLFLEPEQPPKQQQQKEEVQQVPFEFVSEGAEGMITKALIVGNFEAAVETCIRSDRMVHIPSSLTYTHISLG